MNGRLLLRAGVLACVAGCGDGGAGPARQLLAGEPAPESWTAGPERPVIGWVVTPEQLFACETAASQLRAWRRRYGSSVALSVVTVDSEPQLVRSFLRAQRLSDVPVQMLPRRKFRRIFGSPAEPSIFVIHEGRVRGRMSASRPALLDGPRVRGIELLIDSLHSGRDPARSRSSRSTIPGGQP